MFTKRTAEDWLRETLDQARAGALAEQTRTGVAFAQAAREWPRYVEQDRAAKPSTLSQYRSSVHAHFLPDHPPPSSTA